jgi:hypothetical protein
MKKAINTLKRIKKYMGPPVENASLVISHKDARDIISAIDWALEDLEAPPRWYTPEQYKERTGEEWPEDWAVYALVVDWPPMCSYWSGWKILPYGKALEYNHRPGEFKLCIICATEAGKPRDEWKPEA